MTWFSVSYLNYIYYSCVLCHHYDVNICLILEWSMYITSKFQCVNLGLKLTQLKCDVCRIYNIIYIHILIKYNRNIYNISCVYHYFPFPSWSTILTLMSCHPRPRGWRTERPPMRLWSHPWSGPAPRVACSRRAHLPPQLGLQVGVSVCDKNTMG